MTILRLLDTDGPAAPGGGLVTYLAEVPSHIEAASWTGTLSEHPLRMPYARPGGPAADLACARAAMIARGFVPKGEPQQIKSWNLSSLWRIPSAKGDVWLKAVPPFFAHEGAIIDRLQGEPVPNLIARDGNRTLIASIPGEDLFDATEPQRLAMVSALIRIQSKWTGRTAELLAMGLPDWRAEALTVKIADVAARTDLVLPVRATIDAFVADLPRRFAAVASCGVPDTLVHGDFHSGNVRGGDDRLTILDWGDSGVGHPLLDQPAFIERMPETMRPAVEKHWIAEWQRAVPGSDPKRAAALLAPVAAARQAVIYRMFLDHIEPSEHVYHAADPPVWLARAAELVHETPS